MQDEIRRVRLESLSLGEEISATTRSQTVAPTHAFVQTATKDTYPTTANAFYYCQVCSISGTPTEGGSATITPLAGRFLFVYNVGTTIPPVGTQRVAHVQGSVWTMNFCC